jgi:hypothetical protein
MQLEGILPLAGLKIVLDNYEYSCIIRTMVNRLINAFGAGIGVLLGVIVILAILALIAGILVMLVWNWVIPSIFVGAPLISFWQALGLWLLGQLLTGGGSSSSSSKN